MPQAKVPHNLSGPTLSFFQAEQGRAPLGNVTNNQSNRTQTARNENEGLRSHKNRLYSQMKRLLMILSSFWLLPRERQRTSKLLLRCGL